jgi:cobalt-zinc-cadmium efflux system membrane fusion protein
MQSVQSANPVEGSSLRVNPVALAAGVAVSGAAMLVAALFHQAPPVALARAAGIKTGRADVTLAADAEQWHAIRLGTAVSATERWSDPFPGRFKVNEAAAARVGAPVSGRISRVFVELGDPVKAGDKLFSIGSPDLAAFRAEQRKAAIDLEVAKVAHDRVQAMVEARALAGKEELAAAAQVRESDLALRLADAKLASLRVSAAGENELTLVAPRDGVVVEKDLLPAQQVSSNQALLEIADMRSVWAVADVFESDAAGFKAGGAAKLTSSSVPGLAIDAKIEMISSVVDPDRHTVAVRVIVPNPDQRIRPNTYVEMRFQEPPLPQAVEIASSAIVSSGTERHVYVQEGAGHFVRRSVDAGSSHANRVVVTRGLSAGDVVVERGSALLDNQITLDN